MKFSLILFLICTSALAGNFVSPRIVASQLPQAYQIEQECERIENDECVDIAEYPIKVYENYLAEVDDISKPLYETKSNVSSCSGFENCSSIGGVQNYCDSEHFMVINVGYTEVYCTKIVGYEQKEVTRSRTNASALTAYASELATKAEQNTLDNAIAQAERAQNCGRKTMAYMLVRNAPKNLTTNQVDTLVSTYSQIKALLESGSLTTAQEKISSVEADGTIVTESDKTSLISFINGCKP